MNATFSNPDLEYEWVITQPPILGIDRTRGTDGRGKPSPIEDSQIINGKLEWMNPRIRSRFHGPERRMRLMNLLKSGLGAERVGPERQDPDFETFDDRDATRFTIDGVDTHLGRIFALASYGKDENGKDIWDATKYDVGVDKDGAFSSPFQPGEEGFQPNQILWTPVVKPPAPESVMPIDLPTMNAYPGHYWWKSAFGWVMAPFPKS